LLAIERGAGNGVLQSWRTVRQRWEMLRHQPISSQRCERCWGS